jgi:hypothetical protein
VIVAATVDKQVKQTTRSSLLCHPLADFIGVQRQSPILTQLLLCLLSHIQRDVFTMAAPDAAGYVLMNIMRDIDFLETKGEIDRK